MKVLMTKDSGPNSVLKTSLAPYIEQTYLLNDAREALNVFSVMEPDLFFGSVDELDTATVKAINRHPEVKVLLTRKQSVKADKVELLNMIERPFKAASFYPSTDGLRLRHGAHTKMIEDARRTPTDKADLVYIGQFKQEKLSLFVKFLQPILFPNTTHSVKVFGPNGYPYISHLGLIQGNELSHLLNARSVLNLSYSPYVNYRVYQALYAGVPLISNRSADLAVEVGDFVHFVDNAKDIIHLLDNGFPAKPGGQEWAAQNTVQHRLDEIKTYMEIND